LSTGTIEAILADFAKQSAPEQAQALDTLKSAPVKHLDETGIRIEGKTQWLQVICDQKNTHYRAGKKRKEMLENLTGIIVHDHWAPYFQYQNVKHALCNAHHLRELKAVAEIDKEKWAGHMIKLFYCLSSKKTIPPEKQKEYSHAYDCIIKGGLAYHEKLTPLPQKKRGKHKRRKGHNLLRRLTEQKENTIRFMYDQGVPFTNNQAERDLRMIKLQQKISGGFRSMQGASNFCITRGLLSSARKRRDNIFEVIRDVYLAPNLISA
jgi:transposase